MVKNRLRFNHCNEDDLMRPAVTSVECGEDYILSVVFDNGERGALDMKPYLNFGCTRFLRNSFVLSLFIRLTLFVNVNGISFGP